jgi:hypothetical protein
MTFPAIIEATQSPLAGIIALVIGIALSYFGLGLFPVACACCAVVFIAEFFLSVSTIYFLISTEPLQILPRE